jgi:hypothetical protein
VSPLSAFKPPANLAELSADGRTKWSERVSDLFTKVQDESGPLAQFYDPTAKDTAQGAAVKPVTWQAFPGTLLQPGGSDEQRWEQADRSRDKQDEYCEWGVERDDTGRISRVTFTTETPDYFDHLLHIDEARFRELYEDFLGQPVSLDDVRDGNGSLVETNPLNRSPNGRIAHLSEGSNNLFAAVALAGQATVLREKNKVRVTNKKELVVCGGLGNEQRNSDPQVAVAINDLAAQGFEMTLADPPGLYIHDFLSAGLQTPDDADAADFWTITRGGEQDALRAVFEVPAERGYTVSDLRDGDQPIRFGAQLADRVQVRITAVAQPGTHQPLPKPCVTEGG